MTFGWKFLMFHKKKNPPGWHSLASFSFRVASTPRLAQSCLSFPSNHPKIRWNCNIFNCFDKDVRTSTTSCSALNWLHFVNKLLINASIIFFNAFLTVVALTTNFQLAHKYFHLSLLHALCLLEPQTSLKNHAHLFCCMKYNCIMFCHTHSPPSSSVSSSNILCHTVSSWEDNENMRTLGTLALDFRQIDIRCNGDDATKISSLALKTWIIQMEFSLFCDLCTSRSCYALSMMLHSHSEDPHLQ